jgi:hypothetical protein
MRDFTVPSGSCSVSAISWYDSSRMSRKQHGGPERFGQRRHRLAQQRHTVALLERRVWAHLVRHRRQVARIDVAIDRLAFLPHAAVVIDAQVAAHADQPRLEVRAAVERVERLEDLEKDVLRQVLGFVVLGDELVRDVEHLPPVLPDNLFPRLLIAVETPLDQIVDRGRRLGFWWHGAGVRREWTGGRVAS